MFNEIHPKLPMRDKSITRDYYLNKLGFVEVSSADFDGYLMIKKDNIQIHFFEFKTFYLRSVLSPTELTAGLKAWQKTQKC